MSSNISLCFICDEYYVMPTAVAITSVLFNKNRKDVYDIYVVTNNLSNESMTVFKNMETESVRIIIINADKGDRYDKFEMSDFHVTSTDLIKFELPDLLPDELEKVLYLDGDIIVQKDLAVILDENIENVYAGVVSDTPTGAEIFSKYYHKKYSSYFNAGVLLLNLKKMREDQISGLLLEYRNNHEDRYMDQDTFNIIFKEKVKYLSFYYNFHYASWHSHDEKQLAEHYGLKLVSSKYEWIPEAFIIHYSGCKPWQYFHFFASDIWLHYYLLSPFKDFVLHREVLTDSKFDKYEIARIDIKNFGTVDNNVTIECCSDKSAQVVSPAWLKNAQGSGVVVHSKQGNVTLEVKCIGDGNMRLWLRGKDCRDNNGKRYPVWICVTCLQVDGNELFDSPHLVWHDKPFVYNMNVTDGQIVKIYMEWQSATDILAKEREENFNLIDRLQQKNVRLEKAEAEAGKKLRETQQKVKQLEQAKANTEKELKKKQAEVQQAAHVKTEIEKQLKKTKKEAGRVKREFINVKNGWSFKIGRIITYIPRKIKDSLKK